MGLQRHGLHVGYTRIALPSQQLVGLAGDDDEWREWREIGDPVMHIELRRWADLMLIAPLSANRSARLTRLACVPLTHEAVELRVLHCSAERS